MDVSFGNGGVVITNMDDEHNLGESIVQQEDGKLLVSAISRSDNWNASPCHYLLRYTSDGNLDPSFGDGGKILTVAIGGLGWAVDLFNDNEQKIVIGSLYRETSNYFYKVARYLTSGAIDSTFGANGVLDFPAKFNSKIHLLADNSLLYIRFNSNQEISLSRYLQDGTLDVDFGNEGTATSTVVSVEFKIGAIKADFEGNIFVSGTKNSLDNGSIFLMKLKNDGTTDPSFGNNGITSVDILSPFQSAFSRADFDFTNDGKIVMVGSVGGCADEFRPRYQSFFLRYNSDGTLDSSFGNNGVKLLIPSYFQIEQLFIQANQKMIVAGRIQDCFEGSQYFIRRYFDQGHEDFSFSNGLDMEIEYSSSIMQSDGKIVGVGNTHWYEGIEDIVVFRHNNDQLSVPELEKQKISIYPNPSKGLFYIRNFNQKEPYQISDITGKIISKGIVSGHTEFDLLSFKDGIYFLRIGNRTFKLLKG